MKLDKMERNVRDEQETSEKRMEMNWVPTAATARDHPETMQDMRRTLLDFGKQIGDSQRDVSNS